MEEKGRGRGGSLETRLQGSRVQHPNPVPASPFRVEVKPPLLKTKSSTRATLRAPSARRPCRQAQPQPPARGCSSAPWPRPILPLPFSLSGLRGRESPPPNQVTRAGGKDAVWSSRLALVPPSSLGSHRSRVATPLPRLPAPAKPRRVRRQVQGPAMAPRPRGPAASTATEPRDGKGRRGTAAVTRPPDLLTG